MQQFKPYFAGTKDPVEKFGNKNLASVQKCFRTSDIDSVGDESHLTFFEMLGNFSIGGYGKKEAIEYAWELMTSKDWYGLPKDRFFATVFAGDDEIPADTESEKFWKEVTPNIEVKKLGREDNFWPNPVWVGTCGPSSELHYILEDGSSIEVWNLVFTQYFHNEDGSFKDLGKINIDTGMGLERLAMISQSKTSVFEADLFVEVISKLEEKSKNFNLRDARIITDHMKAAIFLACDGVRPSNKEQGYILRRLLRRSEAKAAYGLHIDLPFRDILNIYIGIYKDSFKEIIENQDLIYRILEEEIVSFHKTLEKAFKEFNKIKTKNPKIIPGKEIFYLHATYGLTFEIIKDIAESENVELDESGFHEEFKQHQIISRAGVGKFAGGLAGHSETEIKYHTATHLLHQSLRDVLGPEVFQKGSNINEERLRFDFSYDKKMTDKEIKKVEDMVNQKIEEDLKVNRKFMSVSEAKAMNAIGLFDEKYGQEVSIYCIGPGYTLDSESRDQRDRGGYYSVEFCGGPHVEHTNTIGGIKITKEEAIASGIRRIRAEIVLR